jgi:hypothetical protein
MGMPTGDQSSPQERDPSGSEASMPAPPAASNEAAPPTLAAIAAPEPAPASTGPTTVVAAAPAITIDAPAAAAAAEALKPDLAAADPIEPMPADVRPADLRAEETIAPAATMSRLASLMSSPHWARARQHAPLAASITVALVLGAVAGSIATAGLGSPPASGPAAPTADARAIKESIGRLHAEIGALKVSIDTSVKSAGAHFIKLSDRLDRVEKAQAEPAAKLAKLAETVDRIERRTPPTSAAAARDITGSVAAYAPAPPPAAAENVPPAPVLDGWHVRSVYNGAALIQGRLGGVMEVEPGDNLPGLGRVETIRRQNGKWVVVTSRGLIVAR